jgi:hypothetical protein
VSSLGVVAGAGVADAVTGPGAAAGGAGLVAAGAPASAGIVPAGGLEGPESACAIDGAAQRAKTLPIRAKWTGRKGTVRTFGSNLNDLRARPRTGRENTQNCDLFKDARTRLVGTS